MTPVVELIKQGRALWKAGRLQDAEACFQQAIHNSPQTPHPYFDLATLLEEQKRENSMVIAAYEKFLDLAGNYPNLAPNMEFARKHLVELRNAGKPETKSTGSLPATAPLQKKLDLPGLKENRKWSYGGTQGTTFTLSAPNNKRDMESAPLSMLSLGEFMQIRFKVLSINADYSMIKILAQANGLKNGWLFSFSRQKKLRYWCHIWDRKGPSKGMATGTGAVKTYHLDRWNEVTIGIQPTTGTNGQIFLFLNGERLSVPWGNEILTARTCSVITVAVGVDVQFSQ